MQEGLLDAFSRTLWFWDDKTHVWNKKCKREGERRLRMNLDVPNRFLIRQCIAQSSALNTIECARMPLSSILRHFGLSGGKVVILSLKCDRERIRNALKSISIF